MQKKIIFCRWNSICEKGITRAMDRLGYQIIPLDRKFTSVDYDKEYLVKLSEIVSANRDAEMVFSVNFMPIIARVCNAYHIRYFSWIVDSPCFQLYSETMRYPTNRVFLFDYTQYLKYSPVNPECIFYFPLGCDFHYFETVSVSAADHREYDCDVSFIGSLYSEKCAYNQVAEKLPPYMRGYAEGLIEAQMNVYGYFFLDDVISQQWAEEFKKAVPWNPLASDYQEDVTGIVADTYLGQKCTEQERIRTFQAVGEKHDMHLWTLSDTSCLRNVKVRGGADTDVMMPKIIKCSKINLNLTNRPIKTGLPLRIFDIMGCGGFLISNYQSEIPEYFEPDRDIVLYGSVQELLEKIDYYLKHEDERLQIAQNGYEKVKENFTYDRRLEIMFETL